jgi:predicted nucleotidyltransferase
MDRFSLAKDFVKGIEKKHPDIKKVFLFGSVARREDTEGSDIDLLVVSKGDRFDLRRKITKDVVDTLIKTGVYVSVKTISEKEYQKLGNTFFITEIEKSGVLIG